MQFFKFHPLMMAAIISAGCAAVSPVAPPQPRPDQGLVVFIRQNVIAGDFWNTHFSVDQREVASLNDKEYSYIYLAPGTHTVHASFHGDKDLNFPLEIKAGDTAYVEFRQEIVSKNRVRAVLELIPEHVAAPVVQQSRFEAASE